MGVKNTQNSDKRKINKSLKIFNEDNSINIDILFDILGDYVDRMLILKLSKIPRYASELALDLGISKPAIKKHLEKLLNLGIIQIYQEEGQDRKKDYYCLNPEFGFTLLLDISQNYFNYSIQKTSKLTKEVIERVEDELDEKHQIQVSYYGVFTETNSLDYEREGINNSELNFNIDKDNLNEFEITTLKKMADLEVINQSLKQICRALKDIEDQIDQIEKERINLILKKNELIARLKSILNSFVKNSIERELISSFFYKNVKDFQNGINIRDFLENIYLKIRDKRAGVNLKETTPQYIKKQQDRIKFLESILKEIIKGFKFIKTEKDRETGQEYIKFDL